MVEIWRTPTYIRPDGSICTFKNYIVSTSGRVINLNYRHTGKPEELFGSVDQCGYLFLNMFTSSGTRETCRINRLIASTFIPCPDPEFQANHIDENKLNNNVTNLNWLSAKDNCNHGTHNYRCTVARINHKDLSKPVKATFSDGSTRIFPSGREADRVLGLSRCRSTKCIRECKGWLKSLNIYFEYV